MQAIENCPDCSQCYAGGPGLGIACRDKLMRDALVLLKEQDDLIEEAHFKGYCEGYDARTMEQNEEII